jgi:hypothetical protein
LTALHRNSSGEVPAVNPGTPLHVFRPVLNPRLHKACRQDAVRHRSA